ncbi:winged helix-turn-helix transcriptional regulator [Enterococcus camelliae]|uniref:Winged helix-turn-helix transcriptional regulator n=1 Tax=Enterococcus camelliae TaxID=453959 RepID=A0ABW5TJG5_9ENTE
MIEAEKCDYTLCPKFEKAFSILGKKWNGLIIQVLLEQQEQRFVELSKKIPMLSDRVLSERLRDLEAEEIIEKMDNYYRLTEKGLALQESFESVKSWSNEWCRSEN